MVSAKSLHLALAPALCKWYMATPVVSVVDESREVILLIVRNLPPPLSAIRVLAEADANAYNCGNANVYTADYIAEVAAKYPDTVSTAKVEVAN
jgi:hypothetical protein